jgi:hypothetical protein
MAGLREPFWAVNESPGGFAFPRSAAAAALRPVPSDWRTTPSGVGDGSLPRNSAATRRPGQDCPRCVAFG